MASHIIANFQLVCILAFMGTSVGAVRSGGDAEILENDEPKNDATRIKLSKIYKSCVEFVKASNNEVTLKLLEKIVRDNGGWPITFPTKKWNINDRHLTLQLIHDNYIGIADQGALYDVDVAPIETSTGNKNYEIRIKLPERRLTDDGKRISAASVETMASEFAKRLRGSKISVSYIIDEVAEMMKFEKSLIELESKTVKKLSIRELQKAWNNVVSGHLDYAIDWLQTVRRVFDKTNIEINEKTEIVIEPEDMVQKLGDLLKNNRLRTVVNYIHWNAIAFLAPYADQKMADVINGPRKGSKTSRCVKNMIMDHGLIYTYVKTFFKNFEKIRWNANNMISRIKKTMMKMVLRSSWLETDVKWKFVDKIENVIMNIGYPKWYDEPGRIDEYYNELVIGSNYFDNQVNYNKFRKTKSLKKWHTAYDRNNMDWTISPMEMNAQYDSSDNSIHLPAVIFEMPFCHINEPSALNYGFLGYIIGHEMGHAIDQHGQWYDKFGGRTELSQEHVTKFGEKVKCLIERYNNYTFVKRSTNDAKETINVNGDSTLCENLADHTGVRSALDAYITDMKYSDPEAFEKPPVYKKNVQLFFYSLANYHCADHPSEGHCKKYAPHSVRTNGMISEMPEFTDAFDCPINTPMRTLNGDCIWQ